METEHVHQKYLRFFKTTDQVWICRVLLGAQTFPLAQCLQEILSFHGLQVLHHPLGKSRHLVDRRLYMATTIDLKDKYLCE